MLSKFPITDLSLLGELRSLRKDIINEKIVRKRTKETTNETTMVRGQFPKKNSFRNGISITIGTKFGPYFKDKIPDIIHAAIVKHSRRNPLK